MPFPKLVPAFTAKIPITPPTSIGSAKHGALNQVAFVTAKEGHGGALVSEPGYPIAIDAQFVHGADYIRPDADGQHLRLNVDSVMVQKADPAAFLKYSYTGIITLTPAIGAVLSGAPGAATTPFGNVLSSVVFESGSPALAALEHKVYVGSGRFVVEAGQPVVVEYKISEVVA